MSYLLVLTATINPKGMGNLQISDPGRRLAHYLDAMRFWLTCKDPAIQSILLIENSGWDLTVIRQMVQRENQLGKNVEIIGLEGNDYPRELGKGYGEFLMIDQGLAQSKLALSHSFYAKITGRLAIRNLGRIIRQLPPNYDMALDLWARMADSRLVFWSREFYQQHIVGLYRNMCDESKRYAEVALYDLMLDLPEKHFIPLLPSHPHWIGYSGTHGINYNDWPARLRRPLRQAKRVVWRVLQLPNLEELRIERKKKL